jgi:hypothetical protein
MYHEQPPAGNPRPRHPRGKKKQRFNAEHAENAEEEERRRKDKEERTSLPTAVLRNML